MEFPNSKHKATPAYRMPEGSAALTKEQLGLLRFRKEEKLITDEEYQIIVWACGGVDEDNKIPFVRVGDVLGGLDRVGEFKNKGATK